MDVSRSGFYRYMKSTENPRLDSDPELSADAKTVFKASGETYGSRRMSRALRALGHPVGRSQARSLMRKLGLRVRPTRRFKVTTDSKHSRPVAQNVLAREFDVKSPDRVWAGDITFLWTQQGWLYLAVIIDLYSRKVVGWSLKSRMTTDLVEDALTMAVWRRRPAPGLIHHTDRGSQYASDLYQKALKQHGMVCSMSRKGDCWDNAVVERFFRSLKTERTNHRLYRTREEARNDVIDYIEMFYNSQRLHSYLDYMSPNEFESLEMRIAA
jgi:transposase InsO family protein